MNSYPTKPKIIVICGPTGVGKTSSGIKLASSFAGEIINADSMQIYKYMDIGTAKPTQEEQNAVKHFMIDIITPDQEFNAAAFAKIAGDTIYELNNKGIPPFVIGGTGLYIKTLIHGIFKDNNSDTLAREKLKREIEEKGLDFLYKKLENIDPIAAEKINKNDAYRILRALEVYGATGEAISSYHLKHGFSEKRFDAYKIGLNTDRKITYDKINIRVDYMIEAGFIEEVKALLEKGYSPELKSMQSIGYRQISDYLYGRLSLQEAINIIKRDTRRYAKRQMTWFKADKEIIWVNPNNILSMKDNVYKFLYGLS